jgi:hypothetical protein
MYLLLFYNAIACVNIVVEQIRGKDNILNHLSIPAACFTHPEISMVGLTEVRRIYLSNLNILCSMQGNVLGNCGMSGLLINFPIGKVDYK